MRGRVTVIGAALLLAACGGGDASTDGAVAEGGEVLEGTASDAMLPIATVTSQPPLAPPEPEPRASAPVTSPGATVTSSPSSTPAEEAAPADTSVEAAGD